MHSALPIADQHRVLWISDERRLELGQRLEKLLQSEVSLRPAGPHDHQSADRAPSLGDRLSLVPLDIPCLQSGFQDQRPGKAERHEPTLAFPKDQVRAPKGDLATRIRDGRQKVPPDGQQPLLSRQMGLDCELRRCPEVVLERPWDRIDLDPSPRNKRPEECFQLLGPPAPGLDIVIVHHKGRSQHWEHPSAYRKLGHHLRHDVRLLDLIRNGVVPDGPREGLLTFRMVRQKGVQREPAQLSHSTLKVLRPLLDQGIPILGIPRIAVTKLRRSSRQGPNLGTVANEEAHPTQVLNVHVL